MDEEVVESDTRSKWEDEEDGIDAPKRGDKFTFKRIEVSRTVRLTLRLLQLSLNLNEPKPSTASRATIDYYTASRRTGEPLTLYYILNTKPVILST